MTSWCDARAGGARKEIIMSVMSLEYKTHMHDAQAWHRSRGPILHPLPLVSSTVASGEMLKLSIHADKIDVFFKLSGECVADNCEVREISFQVNIVQMDYFRKREITT